MLRHLLQSLLDVREDYHQVEVYYNQYIFLKSWLKENGHMCMSKFYSAYVHEFEDKSLLLVITEHTKIEPKNIEDCREFIWAPRIESIKRPVHHIALQGVITAIHNNSGLVKRCNKCKSILYDSCPNKCNEGWGWDLRVSSRLYDDFSWRNPSVEDKNGEFRKYIYLSTEHVFLCWWWFYPSRCAEIYWK